MIEFIDDSGLMQVWKCNRLFPSISCSEESNPSFLASSSFGCPGKLRILESASNGSKKGSAIGCRFSESRKKSREGRELTRPSLPERLIMRYYEECKDS